MNDTPDSSNEDMTDATPEEAGLSPVYSEKPQTPTKELIIARYKHGLENAKDFWELENTRAVQMKDDKESLSGVRKLLNRVTPGESDRDVLIQEKINESRKEYAERASLLEELDKGNIQVVIDGTVNAIEELIANDRESRAPDQQSAYPEAKKAIHGKLAELAIIDPQKAEEYRARIYGPEKIAS